jgi:hypothetical protein
VTAIDVYRDDGPLAAALPRGVLPIPSGALIAVAASAPLVAWASPGMAAWIVLAGVLIALIGTVGTTTTRLDWPIPGFLRVLEYGAAVVLVGDAASTYALLAVLAFHHYDIVYRLRGEGPPPSAWLAPLAGGWELRTLLVVTGSLLGRQATLAAVLATVLGIMFVTETIVAWRRQLAKNRPAHPPTP